MTARDFQVVGLLYLAFSFVAQKWTDRLALAFLGVLGMCLANFVGAHP